MDNSSLVANRVWLGLDVGTRRIGISLSNALGIAQPLMTLERTQPRRDQRSILRLARRHGCAGIIVGDPVLLSGAHSRQTERVHHFVAELAALIEAAAPPDSDTASQPASTRMHIHLWDERLTTAEAHAALDATGHSRQQQRHLVDQVAAVLILQGWLDARSGTIALLPPAP